MNLRTRYKRLKQFVERTKVDYREIFIDRTQLEHYAYKSNLPLFYGEYNDLKTDERSFCVAKNKLKDEFSKLIDEHIEILQDGTITLDVWLKPKDSLVKYGVIIHVKVPEDSVVIDRDDNRRNNNETLA